MKEEKRCELAVGKKLTIAILWFAVRQRETDETELRGTPAETLPDPSLGNGNGHQVGVAGLVTEHVRLGGKRGWRKLRFPSFHGLLVSA